MLVIHTILHPTDFSEHADRAFEMACALARSFSAHLVLLHVAPSQKAVTEAALLPVLWDKQAELEDQLRQLAKRHADLHTRLRLERGDAAAEILRAADEDRADLIVIGTHGRTGLGRLLMGSVAEQVVRKAACPVLTVKVPPAEAQSCPESSSDETNNVSQESIPRAFTTPQA